MALKKNVEKNEKQSGHMPLDKLHEKIQVYFAKEYDYPLLRAGDLLSHAQDMHELVVYLGENQYYSDAVARKVFELKIDVDLAVIKIEHLNLKNSTLVNEVEKAFLRGQKPSADKNAVAALSKELEDLAKDVDCLFTRACTLVGDIKEDFQKRS